MMIENINKVSNQIKSAKKVVFSLLLFSLLCGCSSYKSSWDCPKAKGIGCSSLEYADEIAREQILLNTGKHRKSKKKENKLLLNQDLLGGEEYELIEIDK